MLSIVALSTSLLSAGAAATATSGAAPAKSATANITRGGTLTIVEVSSNTIGIDPAGPTNTAGNIEFYPVFEPLFIQVKGNVEPWLASSYKTSNAAKTITITLNKGIHFQDGTPFNAAAVVFNFNRFASITQNSECVPFFKYYSNSTAIGSYKVQVNFTRPDPAFLSAISEECGLMASPAAVTQYGANFGYHPVGTGPFTLSSYGLTGATYVKYPRYWRKGYPLLNQINMILVGSNVTALDAVESGEAQLYYNTTAQDVINARAAGLHTVRIPDEEDTTDVGFNLSAPPFNNVVAREAVAHALNPAPLTAEFGLGLYSAAQSLISPGSWAFPGKSVKGYPTYDPTLAKQLASQIPGGLNFSVIFGNTPVAVQEGSVIQAQLAAVGINMTLVPQQVSTFVSNIHAHTYQAWLSALASPAPPNDPDLIVYRYLDSTSNLNIDAVNDPTMDLLIQKTESTFNRPIRKADYAAINQEIDKVLPWAYLFNTTYWDVESSSLQNFDASFEFPNYWDTWVK